MPLGRLLGLPVPDDLASAWPTSPWNVGSILKAAIRMNADQRRQMEALVRSLPAQPRTGAAPADDYPHSPAALLVRMLRNRNITAYNARILHAVGDGPYVSDATIAGLGAGRVVITAQYVTAFAHLLGYQPSDVVALTGVGPVVKDAKVHPASKELAALAWQARRLSSGQLSDVMAAARTIHPPEHRHDPIRHEHAPDRGCAHQENVQNVTIVDIARAPHGGRSVAAIKRLPRAWNSAARQSGPPRLAAARR